MQRNRFVLLFTIAFLACGDFLRAAETPVDFRTVRDAVLFGPMPELYLAWMKSASCIVHMVVDPTTGNVTNVYVVESSGDAHLNSHVVDALRRWKFRPGTPGLIRISFGEERVMPQRWFVPDREAKHMDKMLAPFLGKRGLVRGELPDYPSTPAWTNKHGTGEFELHVDGSGKVSNVRIMSSSGDPPFDQVTVTALQQWRFRRGPIIVELPLSFVLTSEKFSIYIPKHH